MGKELEGIHQQQQQHHHAQIASPAGPDWALDFMQQSGPGPQQHREFHNDAQFQEFENVFRNAQQQQQGPQHGGKDNPPNGFRKLQQLEFLCLEN